MLIFIIVISIAVLSLRIIYTAVVGIVIGSVILGRSTMFIRLRVPNDFFIHLRVHSASTLYWFSKLSLVSCASLRQSGCCGKKIRWIVIDATKALYFSRVINTLLVICRRLLLLDEFYGLIR